MSDIPIFLMVCGSRTLTEPHQVARIFSELDHLIDTLDPHRYHNVCIISGGAYGADHVAEWYALSRGYFLQVFPAEWDKHGKVAGFIRNTIMVKHATHVAAFLDMTQKSNGTRHSISEAQKYGVPLTVVEIRP